MDDRAENKSSNSKTMWIVIGVIIAFVVLAASVYAVIMATTKKTPSANQLNSTAAKVTDEQLRLTFQEFNTKLDKDKADRATAQQALDDQVKRIKLAN